MIPKKWAESHAFPCEAPKRKIDIERELEEVFSDIFYTFDGTIIIFEYCCRKILLKMEQEWFAVIGDVE
jgi:hypothetical protein